MRISLAAALLFTALLALAPGAPAQQAVVIGNALTWDVDYPGKKITVTARLRFYTRCPPNTSCTPPSAETIARIKNAIESYWNGHRFKCFDFIVKVDAAAVANQASVPQDAVDIALDHSPVAVNSFVRAAANDAYRSDAHRDRVEPARDPTHPSTWWSSADGGIYAHEFGHILGLHDSYDPADHRQGRPGTHHDLMYYSRYGHVSAEMITRVVRRGGKVDESRVRCPMTMEIGPNSAEAFLATIENFRLHAYTCDYDPPSGDPQRQARPIEFTGDASYDGSHIDAWRSLRRNDLVWARGTYAGTIKFSVAPTSNTGMQVQVNPQVRVAVPLGWTDDHLLKAEGDLLLNGERASVVFGVPLRPVFKHGAPECPP